jgi:hypothetical protein
VKTNDCGPAGLSPLNNVAIDVPELFRSSAVTVAATLSV